MLVDFVGRVRRVIHRLIPFGSPLTCNIAVPDPIVRDLVLYFKVTDQDGHGVFKGRYTTSELLDVSAHA
jgi:hypothetical protein